MNFKLLLQFVVQIVLLFNYGWCVLNGSYVSDDTRILSRRKRFLLFPDGSSFQLVFCVQTAALIPIGDIFLYGNTAALAWNLPTDPQLFSMFKDQVRVAQRREDNEKNVYYLDKTGKLIAKVPYKRARINPAFSKRSTDKKLPYKEKLYMKIHRMKMHEQRLKEDFLKIKYTETNSLDFHRSSRLSLFEKLEMFFSAVGPDGRQCVLYKLCTAGRPYAKQGTFLQEVFRVIFTLPKDSTNKEEEYDKAHIAAENCERLYPECEELHN